MTSDPQAAAAPKDPGLPNPFVGPRPFQRGERLYGRSRETRGLFYLLTTERIVWLHSPSGAGKTSLMWASLAPRLERDGFSVWPSIRVNLDLPREQLGSQAGGVNRYLLSAILSLEEGLPEVQRRPVETLAQLKFSDYIAERLGAQDAGTSTLLVFDQFEEILTVDPLRVAEKSVFFQVIGDTLRNPNLWALFSLREEFLAQLEPYIDWIPTRWSNTFRLELLGEAAVGEVVKRTAEQGGRTFTDPAAQSLFKVLARTKVQQPDGSFVEETGQNVEPVQLQAVCRRLWAAMPRDDLSIDREDLERFGDVSEALGAYYDDSIAGIASGDVAAERRIREWLGNRLITATGIRGQVPRGKDASEGLDNDVIQRLLDTHLVRGKKRAGATWYELAHDRLVRPVKDSNAAWLKRYLQPFQHRAALWVEEGRPASGGDYVLRGRELAAALGWQRDNYDLVTGDERELLLISKAAKRRRLWVRFGLGLVVVLSLVFGGVTAYLAARAAEKEREVFHQVATTQWNNAIAKRERDPLRAAHYFALASEAFSSAEEPKAAANADLARKYNGWAPLEAVVGHAESVVGAVMSADQSRILTWSKDGSARVWSSAGGEALTPPMQHEGWVLGARFSADESRILTWSSDGSARLWDISIDAEWPDDKDVLRVQVETGTVLKPTGELQVLSPAAWQEKKWCNYDAIQYRLKRIAEEQGSTSQRLCRELKEKTKARQIQIP